jgi:hypothetical protein
LYLKDKTKKNRIICKERKINIFSLYLNIVLTDLPEIAGIVIMMCHHRLISYLIIEIYQENLTDIDKHYLIQHNHNRP